MSNFPETLVIGQLLTRELTKEIERRYNTYVELERQLAVSEQARMEADELVLKQNAQLQQNSPTRSRSHERLRRSLLRHHE